MIIALAITLIAIFASNQVQTAFFRLSEINAQIASAQARATELEKKVTSSHVCVGLDSLMGPRYGVIPHNSPAGLRNELVRNFYNETVAYLNREYTRPGPCSLKKYSPPSNVDERIAKLANRPEMEAWTNQTDVLLLVQAGANLYPNDPIEFEINAVPDRLLFASGQPIATLGPIPAGKLANAQLAVFELVGPAGAVPRAAYQRGMPGIFAGNTAVGGYFPSRQEMQRMLSGTGSYVMTAYAATNIFPHTFGVPVAIVLQKLPAQ